MKTAIVITSYNRPHLVADAIASVREQDTSAWRLYIMDDGSNDETIRAIDMTCGWSSASSLGLHVSADERITLCRLPDRPMVERKASIPYSRLINFALNTLLRDEETVTYLCDDDVLLPGAIQARATYLDQHPEVHICYGRQRSVQYDTSGCHNRWAANGLPFPGRRFRRPTGRRVVSPDGASARTYFAAGEGPDPETGLPYVEEAFWQAGPMRYGQPHRIDHNQICHRRCCLTECAAWPLHGHRGGREFWGEDLRWGVGDACFFTRLAAIPGHEFHGVDAWCTSKRYHAKSWGNPDNEQRE